MENNITTMALDRARRELLKYQNNINSAHRFDHTKRVFNICKEILSHHKKANTKVVLLAAAFHDIGRTKKEGDHAAWSEDLTKQILEENDFLDKLEDEEKKNVLKIVLYHNVEEDEWGDELNNLIEFKILVDADRIDSFGPIGIIRASLDPRFQGSSKSQLDHIKEKYDPGNFKLNTSGGKKVGGPYKDYLLDFERKYQEQQSMGNLDL